MLCLSAHDAPTGCPTKTWPGEVLLDHGSRLQESDQRDGIRITEVDEIVGWHGPQRAAVGANTLANGGLEHSRGMFLRVTSEVGCDRRGNPLPFPGKIRSFEFLAVAAETAAGTCDMPAVFDGIGITRNASIERRIRRDVREVPFASEKDVSRARQYEAGKERD